MARQGDCSMKARPFHSILARALGVAQIFASGWVSAETLYRLTDLGTLGGNESEASAMNASGKVTGRSLMTGDASSHAFLWDGNSMQDLGTLGGTSSFGLAINGSGRVGGQAQTGSLIDHAFLWDGTNAWTSQRSAAFKGLVKPLTHRVK